MKILVTNGAYKHTLALVRSLGAAGHEVGVVAHRWAASPFFSKYCSHRHIIKTTDKQLFVDNLLTILQETPYDILLPVGLPTVVWLAERADEIRKFTRLPIAEVGKITLLGSKQATYELACQLNIPTPLTFFPKDCTDADICAVQLKPPIVVKHCTRSGSQWLRYAQTAEEAVLFFEEMKRNEATIQHFEENSKNTEGYVGRRKRRELTEISRTWSVLEKNIQEKNVEETFNISQMSNLPLLQTSNLKLQTNILQTNILFQEYLSGGGYGFFGLYDKGVFKQGFAHKRIREFPMSGGASACAESIEEEELTILGRRILDATNWHGLAMVEFKKDEAEQFRLLEVNPKLWGSFDLSVAAGVPFTEKWVQLAMNQTIEPHQDYERGIRFSWLMEGDIQNGWQTGNVWKILRGAIFDKKTHTNLTWRDPLTSLFLIASGLKFR